MKLIDLHCDTLYKSVENNMSIYEPSYEVQPFSKENNRIQCYAIWLPDEIASSCAERKVFEAHNKLVKECRLHSINIVTSLRNVGKTLEEYSNNAIFTIENALAINGKLENIKKFSELGVKIITLTWNSHNELGDGAMVENPKGLTEFGKNVVIEMENNKVIVDVSHASDAMFYDVASIAKRPFIATHSNSRSVASNKRNLTDEQFKIITDKGGIVGMNFHNAFLNDTPDNASITDIIKHTEHFLSIGGENALAIGSDFDGGTPPADIKNSNAVSKIFELFLRHNYKESLIKKIFYENAVKFLENFDN